MNRILLVCEKEKSAQTLQTLLNRFLQAEIVRASQLQQAQALLDKLPNSTQLDQRLQHAILTGLQKNQYQIDFIARKLGVSVRQLQRHLQQQNATFQERVQEVRFMLNI